MSEARMAAPPDADARMLPLAPGLIVVAVLCWAGNELGVSLRYPDMGAAILYAPYAFLTAALLTSKRKHWIWYILVAVLAHFAASWLNWPLSWLLLSELANLVRAFVAAELLRR